MTWKSIYSTFLREKNSLRKFAMVLFWQKYVYSQNNFRRINTDILKGYIWMVKLQVIIISFFCVLPVKFSTVQMNISLIMQTIKSMLKKNNSLRKCLALNLPLTQQCDMYVYIYILYIYICSSLQETYQTMKVTQDTRNKQGEPHECLSSLSWEFPSYRWGRCLQCEIQQTFHIQAIELRVRGVQGR